MTRSKRMTGKVIQYMWSQAEDWGRDTDHLIEAILSGTGLSEDGVRRQLKRLEERDWVTRQRKPNRSDLWKLTELGRSEAGIGEQGQEDVTKSFRSRLRALEATVEELRNEIEELKSRPLARSESLRSNSRGVKSRGVGDSGVEELT
jgi:DNA-binding MarR family transcriptional regulator